MENSILDPGHGAAYKNAPGDGVTLAQAHNYMTIVQEIITLAHSVGMQEVRSSLTDNYIGKDDE